MCRLAGDFNGNGCDTLSHLSAVRGAVLHHQPAGSGWWRVGRGGLFVLVRRRGRQAGGRGLGSVTGSTRSVCIVSRRASSTTATRCRRGSHTGSSISVIRVTGSWRVIGGSWMVRTRRVVPSLESGVLLPARSDSGQRGFPVHVDGCRFVLVAGSRRLRPRLIPTRLAQADFDAAAHSLNDRPRIAL